MHTLYGVHVTPYFLQCMNLGGYALGMVLFTANSTALYHFVSLVGGTTVAVHFN